MLQLFQSSKNGEMRLMDVPPPRARPGWVHVRNAASVVSPGTERLMQALASKSLAGKAKARPDLVRQVLEKAQRDGPVATYRAVKARLEQAAPVGYATAGTVVEGGADAEAFRPGALVACAGAGYACHAEEVLVPSNLVVPVPPGVTAEKAAFAAVGAIALQGVRTLKPELGETVAVVGLGLLGLLAMQMLRAAGCKVVGSDLDPERVRLANALGATAWETGRDDLRDRFGDATAGHGVDAVLVAAGTRSNAPMVLAGEIAADRGRIVVLGAVKTEFDRNVFYMKELEVRLSRSLGPGRYDPDFEERGHAYPRSYVRFSETENLRVFLDMVADGRVDLDALVTHRYPIDRGLEAYALLQGARSALGIVLEYDGAAASRPLPAPVPAPRRERAKGGRPAVTFIGAGSFAQSVLIPAFAKRAKLHGVVTGRGYTAADVAQRYGFGRTFERSSDVFADDATEAVVVTTRHDQHAGLTQQALAAGKHVFCEKPLALSYEEIDAIESAHAESGAVLQVGFNRRFSPMVRRLRSLRMESPRPAMLSIRVNAGALPRGHWAMDAGEGGGRLVGEGCHFVDLARYVVGSPIAGVSATGSAGEGVSPLENFALALDFQDGSAASIVYTSLGEARLGKERFELFAGGTAVVLDDYRSLRVLRAGKETAERGLVPDKGHGEQVEAFVASVAGGTHPPIPAAEIFEVSRATLAAVEALSTGVRLAVPAAAPRTEAAADAPETQVVGVDAR